MLKHSANQIKQISLLSALDRFSNVTLHEISSFIIMDTIPNDDDFKAIGNYNILIIIFVLALFKTSTLIDMDFFSNNDDFGDDDEDEVRQIFNFIMDKDHT